MKQFNWEEFLDKNNKIAVHCKTEEESKDFCKQMHEHGINWCCGYSYILDTSYKIYEKRTCYTGCGGYSTYDYYINRGYKILEWSDYMKKEFTKADLKDGMVVEYANGKRRLVLNNFLIGKDGYFDLSNYSENLKDKNSSDRDIVSVFKINIVTTLDNIFHTKNLELIWERKEIKSMTTEEMRQKLEELTGEKIEVEPSIREKCWELEEYCDKTSCSVCCLSNGRCTWNADVDDKENVEECYKKIMEQEK